MSLQYILVYKTSIVGTRRTRSRHVQLVKLPNPNTNWCRFMLYRPQEVQSETSWSEFRLGFRCVANAKSRTEVDLHAVFTHGEILITPAVVQVRQVVVQVVPWLWTLADRPQGVADVVECAARERCRVVRPENAFQAHGEVHGQVQPNRIEFRRRVVTPLVRPKSFDSRPFSQATFGYFVRVPNDIQTNTCALRLIYTHTSIKLVFDVGAIYLISIVKHSSGK